MSVEESHRDRIRPSWEEQFPILWEEDEYVTRREFTKSLGLVSLAAFVATAAVAVFDSLRRRFEGEHSAARIAKLDSLAVDQSMVFHHPGPGDPCLLILLQTLFLNIAIEGYMGGVSDVILPATAGSGLCLVGSLWLTAFVYKIGKR